MKILNLYAGIGGNRKYWSKDHQVTSVELDPLKAAVYKKYFPQDEIIIADAHDYLLHHYKEYDFIWSSPSCITHSRIRKTGEKGGKYDPKYVDLSLYEEIIFLQEMAKCKYCVENVKPFYEPLIKPTRTIGRHMFWTNFPIGKISLSTRDKSHNYISKCTTIYGFNIRAEKIDNHRQVLRNLVDPEIGNHVLKSAECLNYHPGSQLALAF